jgi:CRISPR-associated protein Csd1
MFLKALLDFSSTIGLPPRMYKTGNQHWEIELGIDGKLKSVRPLHRTVIQTKRVQGKKEEVEQQILGVERELPHISRNGVNPKLLTDTAEYVLKIGEDSERALLYHDEYCKLAHDCFESTGEVRVKAVAIFSSSDPFGQVSSFLERFPVEEEIDQSHAIGFLVDGIDPTQLPSVQQYWADYTDRKMVEKKEFLSQPCLVTGEVKPVARKSEFKIQGVPRALPQGASLVSAFRDSFMSYGLTQNENTPISVDALEKVSKALNYLLSDRQHHIRIGNMVYVYWGATEQLNPLTLITEPTTEDLRNNFTSPASTLRSEIDALSFHLAVLSSESAGGRIIVRSFSSQTLGQIQNNLKTWFEYQGLIDNYTGAIGNPVGIFQLAAVTQRVSKNLEIPARVVDSLSSAALYGKPIPREVLQKVVLRIRQERQVLYAQAVLIKTILMSEGIKLMPELDQNMESLAKPRDKMAYACGRLMAVFESIQWYAVKDVAANVTSRYYSSASSKPALVLGVLATAARNHLSKLRTAMPGMAVILDRELQDIYSSLPSAALPNALTLQERAIFDMGYYQQKSAVRQKAGEKKAEKKTTEVTENSLALSC